jgi:hypothetical protein
MFKNIRHGDSFILRERDACWMDEPEAGGLKLLAFS